VLFEFDTEVLMLFFTDVDLTGFLGYYLFKFVPELLLLVFVEFLGGALLLGIETGICF
jgi:hypothetical protein